MFGGGQIGPQVMPNMSGPGMGNHGNPSLMDPASNNQPLQFNTSKGKPPMAIPGNGDSSMTMGNDDRGSNDVQSPNSLSNMMSSVGGPNMGSQNMGPNMGGPMGPGNMQQPGPWGPMVGPNMMGMDPSMMMGPMQGYGGQQGPFGYMGPMGPMDGGPMQKEMITLKSCTLYPPPPNAPPPTTRERPPGCRTMFVGGLPELMTEDFLREIFENFGTICSLRMSKKNFAHVRYEEEDAVDRAIYLSGYRIKIENKDDKPNTGRIHVDYAQARDDLYEWECKVRAFNREERHRIRVEQDRLRPPSPPPTVHYSDHEAGVLMENLKGDQTFPDAASTLITWLERGDCSRRSSNTFYSLIQCVNAHVRRLVNEKQQHDEELENIKIEFQRRMEGIVNQFDQIERVFAATSKQKAWDHFTKAQRKNLDTWRKQAKETSKEQHDAFFKQREEAEMEMSDNEDTSSEPAAPKKKKHMDPTEYAQAAMLQWQTTQLKDENDSLRCQLEAYKNEVELLKQETKLADDTKDKQTKALQQALQGMQQQLISTKLQMKQDAEEIKVLKGRQAKQSTPDVTQEMVTVVVVDADAENDAASPATTKAPPTITKADSEGETSQDGGVTTATLGDHTTLPEKEARILALLSTFLHVHPFGASVDYIWSYLQRLSIVVRSGELEALLERYPGLYQQTISGVGATLEKRWKFVGFDTDDASLLL